MSKKGACAWGVLILVAGIIYFYADHRDIDMPPSDAELQVQLVSPLAVQNGYFYLEELWKERGTNALKKISNGTRSFEMMSYVSGQSNRHDLATLFLKENSALLQRVWGVVSLGYQDPTIELLVHNKAHHTGLGGLTVDQVELFPVFLRDALELMITDIKVDMNTVHPREAFQKMKSLTPFLFQVRQSVQTLHAKKSFLKTMQTYTAMLKEQEITTDEMQFPDEKKALSEMRRSLLSDMGDVYRSTIKAEYLYTHGVLESTFSTILCSFHCSYTVQPNHTYMMLYTWYTTALAYIPGTCQQRNVAVADDLTRQTREIMNTRDVWYMVQNSEGLELLRHMLPTLGEMETQFCGLEATL